MFAKGKREFEMHRRGDPLSRKQAILAHCYECNGGENVDCQGNSCPLYGYFPYKGIRKGLEATVEAL